jgi:N-acetylglucosaminyldiphosphoundecaprenol N-acetyl-beta-D-mannosaminyltransferase
MREIYLFNIRFLDGDFSEIYSELKKGGAMVVPAAPALGTINIDRPYHQALINSHFAIFDSGFLCISLLLLKGIKVKKISGLAFIREFLKEVKIFPNNSIFLIDPSAEDGKANKELLKTFGYQLNSTHQYVAPIYNREIIEDSELLTHLHNLKPAYIILNLGGGVQEKLAAYLQQNLIDFNPSIICTGAAIAFLTGRQASIPRIIDRLYLGWLARCISNYKIFLPRYMQGFKIAPMVLKEKISIKQKYK